jgi:Holliday junction resolvase RusA-like endonuclease
VTTKTGKTFAHVYTPAASNNEMGVVRYYAERAMNGRPPLTGAVDLRISMFMPIPASMSKRLRAAALATPPTHFPTQKPDWDNQGKYMDALKQVVWVDDKQVVDGHVFKRYSDRPRIVIEIRSKVGEL